MRLKTTIFQIISETNQACISDLFDGREYIWQELIKRHSRDPRQSARPSKGTFLCNSVETCVRITCALMCHFPSAMQGHSSPESPGPQLENCQLMSRRKSSHWEGFSAAAALEAVAAAHITNVSWRMQTKASSEIPASPCPSPFKIL